MFVRCLDGQYRGSENEDVREYVMSTSDMNKAVMYAALDRYDDALQILYKGDVPENSAKVEYLKAICHFRKQNDRMKALDRDAFTSDAVYKAEEDDVDDANEMDKNSATWAAPMLNALRLDNDNAKYLETDGYFNNAYRQMIFYFWKRMQAGVPIEKVASEYDALVAQMRANAKKNKN